MNRVLPNLFLIPLIVLIAMLPASALACSNPPAIDEVMVVHTTATPTVNNTTGNVTMYSILTVVISLSFTFGLFIIGIVAKDFFLKFVSGVVWIFAGLYVYLDYNVGWFAISICVGLYLMIVSAFAYEANRKGG